MRFMLAVAIVPGLPGLASPQGQMDLYQTWASFVASSAAYEKCGANDGALKQKFAANFLAVASLAAERARMEHPYNPARDLANAMEGRRKAIKSKVEEEIAKSGCASDGVKELLKLYESNANSDAAK
jgi:hypothetical protein